jgi:hypothetical protein
MISFSQKLPAMEFPTASRRVYQCSINGRNRKAVIFPNLIKIIQPDKRTFRQSEIQPKRGEITGFSAKSRNRLIKFMATISREQLRNSYMLTLTYPDFFETNFETYKAHFCAWKKRLSRRNPEIKTIWKLEFQKRGAPHFHILMFFPQKLSKDEFKSEIQFHKTAWFEIVNSNDDRHFKAGTRFEGAENFGQLSNYVSKYFGKDDYIPKNEKIGRIWGKSAGFTPEIIAEIPLKSEDVQRLKDLLVYQIEERIQKPLSDDFKKWLPIVPTVSFYKYHAESAQILMDYGFVPVYCPPTVPCLRRTAHHHRQPATASADRLPAS